MRVVVTGGAGFIGSNLCRTLLADAAVTDVVVLDDLSTGTSANLVGVEARLVEGSILDREALDDATSGADAIVHLAARPSVPRSIVDPIASHHANATGTIEVLEAARRAGDVPVVLASSSSVYGANPVLPKHEGLRPMPVSPYAVSKLATESYASAYTHSYGLPTLSFRFFNVFGPRQPAGHAYAAVVPAFVDAALRGQPLPVHGDGRQTRDFTFVETVAAELTRAVTGRVASVDPVNLAFGTRTDLLTLAGLLGEVLGHEVALEHQPPRAGDVHDSQADTTALLARFGEVEPVTLREGLTRTVAWMREALAAEAADPSDPL